MKTKQNEIDILKEAAEKLGSNSYCGPWLAEQIPLIDSEIRSDFDVGSYSTLSFKAARRQCEENIANAETRAKEILAAAEKEAARIREEARKESVETRLRLIADLRRAADRLQ